jgi:putative acetyltransferase
MPSAGVTLRPMTRADRAEVFDVWTVSWTQAYPAIDFAARRAWMDRRLDELEKAGAHIVVALDGARIVGLVTVDPSTGYLDQLVVATTHQRRGIAAILLDDAKLLSRSRIDLHVNQDNAKAIAFYRKQGFAVSGESVNERSGTPTYKMSWRA